MISQIFPWVSVFSPWFSHVPNPRLAFHRRGAEAAVVPVCGNKPCDNVRSSKSQEASEATCEMGQRFFVNIYKVVPPSYKLVYNPINYRYITYKP
jgi:hypothetical protein